jgi:hypothetical protein
VVWSGKGYARGYPMSSFRAEAYGRLGFLVFLKNMMEFHQVKPHEDTKIDTYCDNDPLRKRLIAAKDPWSPSFFLKADTDVMMEIEETKTKIPITESFYWVKGHQDDENNTPFEDRPWPVQLNILADEQATEALNTLQQRRTYPPPMIRLPACPIYLLAQGREQTSHELNTLRTDMGRDKMEQYMMKLHKWSFGVLKTVAWFPYERAMNSLTDAERVFVVKLSHNWLPVGKKQHQIGAENDQCVLCTMAEDTDHLFQCPQRKEWRIGFIKALDTQLKTLDTAADTRKSIINGLEEWMNKRPSIESPQDTIGWDAFIKGYIHQHWVEQQDIFYTNKGRKDARRHNGNYWATHLINFLWQQDRKLWKGRNEEVHKPDDQEKDSPEERRTLKTRIRILYGSKPKVREADRRNFFSQSLEDVLKGPTRELRAWLTTSEPPIKKAIQDAVILERLRNNDIRDYYEKRHDAPS